MRKDDQLKTGILREGVTSSGGDCGDNQSFKKLPTRCSSLDSKLSNYKYPLRASEIMPQ